MRLIDADALMRDFLKDGDGFEVCVVYDTDIKAAPTIDAVPVEVLKTIVWYNGHEDWLRDLADKLEQLKEGEGYMNPFSVDEWFSERHMFWEILVGMFGAWGASIRSGWIEKPKEAAAFIKKLIDEEGEE